MFGWLKQRLRALDDIRGGPSMGWTAVLSHSFWYERFGGDPQIIGKQIEISKTFVTVVGVTPPEFQGLFPGERPRIYLPLQFLTVLIGKAELDSPETNFSCWPIGRLKPGVDFAQVNSEMAVYQPELIREFVSPDQFYRSFIEKSRLQVSSARTGLGSSWARRSWQPLLLMQGLVAVVLLLCCVNVGGLMMSTVHARRREFAVRMAMGAGRWRLIRQYLTESFVIAAAGALLGAVLTTLLFGAAPAWYAGRSDPGTLLKSRTALGGRRRIAGRAFVPIQVALSVAMVASAGLLSRSLIRIRVERSAQLHPKFDGSDFRTPAAHGPNRGIECRRSAPQHLPKSGFRSSSGLL
jgi:hypothetical protein